MFIWEKILRPFEVIEDWKIYVRNYEDNFHSLATYFPMFKFFVIKLNGSFFCDFYRQLFYALQKNYSLKINL